MPLDGSQVETPALRRTILVDALRNDREWKWNFCLSAGCAIGMAKTLWPKQIKDQADLPQFFGLKYDQILQIFGWISTSDNRERGLPEQWCEFYQMERTKVTPEMVADALESL